MGFRLLIPILNNGLENASIGGHNSWLENNLHIVELMRRDLNLFRIDFKGKLFNSIRSLLADIELHIASHFVTVFNLDLLDDALWDL